VENWDRTNEELISKPVQSNNQEEQPIKRSKKKSKLSQAIAQSKPIFDPSRRKFFFRKKNANFIFLEEKSFEQYFDEYYKLDCEDFIGDMPIRFQYRQVEPNDFGLSIEEVKKIDLKKKFSITKKNNYFRYLQPKIENLMHGVH
jgi:protein KRI1